MSATPRYDCDDTEGLIGLFALDALTAEEAAGVREHLATCDQPHGDASVMAAASGALAVSTEPVDAPAELRSRLMSAISVTAQVPDDVQVVTRPAANDVKVVASVAPVAATDVQVISPAAAVTPSVRPSAEPISIEAARQRRGPSRTAWFGLAAAAVIVIAALGAWNVSLQRQVSDTQGQVASLQQAVTTANAQLTTAQQQATEANAQLASLQTQITETQAQLTAAVQRANSSDAQVASLQGQDSRT